MENEIENGERSEGPGRVWPHWTFAVISFLFYFYVAMLQGVIPFDDNTWRAAIAHAVGSFGAVFLVGFLLSMVFGKRRRVPRALIICAVISWLMLFRYSAEQVKEEAGERVQEQKEAERTGLGFFDPKQQAFVYGYEVVSRTPVTSSSNASQRKFIATYIVPTEDDYLYLKHAASTYALRERVGCEGLVGSSREFLYEKIGPVSQISSVQGRSRGGVLLCEVRFEGSAGGGDLFVFSVVEADGEYRAFINMGDRALPERSRAGDRVQGYPEILAVTPYDYLRDRRAGVAALVFPPPDDLHVHYSVEAIASSSNMDELDAWVRENRVENKVSEITCRGMAKTFAETSAVFSKDVIADPISSYHDESGASLCLLHIREAGESYRLAFWVEHVGDQMYVVKFRELSS